MTNLNFLMMSNQGTEKLLSNLCALENGIFDLRLVEAEAIRHRLEDVLMPFIELIALQLTLFLQFLLQHTKQGDGEGEGRVLVQRIPWYILRM